MTLWTINQTLINLIILTTSAFTLALISLTILKMIIRAILNKY
jgi:hypothetical protein